MKNEQELFEAIRDKSVKYGTKLGTKYLERCDVGDTKLSRFFRNELVKLQELRNTSERHFWQYIGNFIFWFKIVRYKLLVRNIERDERNNAEAEYE